jgi:hypothetical protein
MKRGREIIPLLWKKGCPKGGVVDERIAYKVGSKKS